MSWLRLAWNSIIAGFHSLLCWTTVWIPVMGTYVYDWKHYPNYEIYIYEEIAYDNQLYVEDVQLEVKYTINEKGAILGYVGADALIDLTNWVAHITKEGTIIVWGPDNDADGMLCVVWPYNCQIVNISVGHGDLDIQPIPDVSATFDDTNVRWQNTDRPNHWFLTSPKVSIDVKYNRLTEYPYVDTTFWANMVSRYDDKKYDAHFVVRGFGQTNFVLKPPQIEYQSFLMRVDRAAWAITLLQRKYQNEPDTFDNYRRVTYMP